MNRKIEKTFKGMDTQDGAGVRLTRVLDKSTAVTMNPFVMLDSFDSKNFDDYRAGFPTHPHRGIETVSYIHKGGITHEDSLGNKHRITDRQVQWMNAGSGIMHSETFQEEEHLLGLQIWINLPSDKKMSHPSYLERKGKVTEEDFGIRSIYSSKEDSGSENVPVIFEVLEIKAGETAEVKMDENDRSYLFTLVGGISVEGEEIGEKTAALLSDGDSVKISALDEDTVTVVLAAPKLTEQIAWGGPIVMNTKEELMEAFKELQNDTFIKEETEDISK